jgi:hypothetical protein
MNNNNLFSKQEAWNRMGGLDQSSAWQENPLLVNTNGLCITQSSCLTPVTPTPQRMLCAGKGSSSQRLTIWSIFLVFLSFWMQLLAKYTGESYISVGSDCMKMEQEESENSSWYQW